MKPKITLEQWQSLIAVVDAGGYAQAAEQLNKSQSAVSYSVQKMESVLNLQIFELSGRKSVLTPAGQSLYRRARSLVDEASLTEQLASQFAAGMQAEIDIAVDTITPPAMLMKALATFAEEAPLIRVQLHETVLSGGQEAIDNRSVDLAITGNVFNAGKLETSLMQVRFLAVAHPDHPLHHFGRTLQHGDLKRFRQLVVRDSGSKNIDSGWLQADQRWTFSHMSHSVQAAVMGLGYAWYPETRIQRELDEGKLKLLPMDEGSIRFARLALIYPNGEFSGPAVLKLGTLIRDQAEKDYPDLVL